MLKGKPTRSEIREFSTLIPDMIALRNWIVSKNCHHVAMESTGIYWMQIYEILEDAFSGDITLLVVNARLMKNVPGKKTDMRDSEWISTLLRAGLLNGSFIPEKRIREFRDLNRYRKSVIRDITSIRFLVLVLRQESKAVFSICPCSIKCRMDFHLASRRTSERKFYSRKKNSGIPRSKSLP